MASTSSMKVSPINNEPEIGLQAIDGLITYENDPQTDDDAANNHPDEPQNIKMYLKKTTWLSKIQAMANRITYDNAKWAMRWFLESATFKVTLSVRKYCFFVCPMRITHYTFPCLPISHSLKI